ncbi:hypothetical protein QYE76_032965 [Lolium multiflorum]|uniref:Uncharacterized protein n=1 Tax=Lolium multiflorum TaxID=4521 RepID=A0AAD8QV76_LOLMU|nr:hypothetical protein QYE76_032965 [Lolium multiflorum]
MTPTPSNFHGSLRPKQLQIDALKREDDTRVPPSTDHGGSRDFPGAYPDRKPQRHLGDAFKKGAAPEAAAIAGLGQLPAGQQPRQDVSPGLVAPSCFVPKTGPPCPPTPRRCPGPPSPELHQHLSTAPLQHHHGQAFISPDKTLLDTTCSGSFTRNKEEFKRDLLDRIKENAEDWENDKGKESGYADKPPFKPLPPKEGSEEKEEEEEEEEEEEGRRRRRRRRRRIKRKRNPSKEIFSELDEITARGPILRASKTEEGRKWGHGAVTIGRSGPGPGRADLWCGALVWPPRCPFAYLKPPSDRATIRKTFPETPPPNPISGDSRSPRHPGGGFISGGLFIAMIASGVMSE